MTWLSTSMKHVLLASDSGVWADEDMQNGVSVLRSTNMKNDGTIDLAKLTLRAIPTNKRDSKLLAPGDTLLENSGGGPKQPVGRVCYFSGDTRDHVAGNFCRRLRPNRKLVVPKFLFWNLYYAHLSGETLRFQTQTTGLRNLQFRAYSGRAFALPALSEQARITELLDEADRLRRLRREADDKAARILPALFLEMFGDPATNPKLWPVEEFSVAFKDQTAGQKKVQANTFLPNGMLPIIDQGQKPIAGYVDDLLMAYKGSLPAIVFGDHTRIFKFVDHPFVLGADGVRVLTARDGFLPLFAYWHCRMLDIPCVGYSRHFKFLKERSFMHPDTEQQDLFSKLAIALTEDIERIDKLANRLDTLFSTLLEHAFSGQLTAKWRAAHMKEVLAEMEEQARLLDLPIRKELETNQ